MVNHFKHTGFIKLSNGSELPYAFGPNQSAMLCQLMGWEFWEHEENVLPALYAVSLYTSLATNPDATAEQKAEASQHARRSLFNNPVFVQAFYCSALTFGCELEGIEMPLSAAEVGAWQQQEPKAFLPILTKYAEMQTLRNTVAEARPLKQVSTKKKTTAK